MLTERTCFASVTENRNDIGKNGMERLESTCMLLIAIGESIKGVDKLTNKGLLTQFPKVDWKGAMGIRDIIAHHYFDWGISV